MKSFFIWITVLTYQFKIGNSDCLEDLFVTPYTGNVSTTNNGLPCQAWSTQIPHEHSCNTDDLFPYDGSVAKAKNYCRDVWNTGIPWCYTNHPDIRVGYCTYVICPELYHECGAVLKNLTGTITAPDYDGDGLYDLHMDCIWIIEVEEIHVIRYTVVWYEIERYEECTADSLWIYEKRPSESSILLCGSSDGEIEGETISNVLYVQFFSDSSVQAEGFRITYQQMKAFNKVFNEYLTESSGWINSPDLDGDGFYDFNVNCLWVIKANDDRIISFNIEYVLIRHSEKCVKDRLEIEDDVFPLLSLCGYFYFVPFKRETVSNTMYLRFTSDNSLSAQGFNVTYEEKIPCLDSLTGYNGTVSTTNNGFTCKSYCRDEKSPGVPWCGTTDVDVTYDLCTLSICTETYIHRYNNRLMLRNEDYIIVRREEWYKKLNCFWTIKSAENEVINYLIEIFAREIPENCPNYFPLLLFEGGDIKGFCSRHYKLIVRGESQSNRLFVSYYGVDEVHKLDFNFFYRILQANKICEGIFRDPVGWIVSPDNDGDGFYDFNLNCLWTVEGPDDTFILLHTVFIHIEFSENCDKDILWISDDTADLAGICGTFDKKDPIKSRTNHLFIRFITNDVNTGFGFNIVYQIQEVSQTATDDCLNTILTSPYTGTVSVTNHGRLCQAWATQSPHIHERTDHDQFPNDGSVLGASNYCRSFVDDPRPWCYTTDPNVYWEYCTFSICNVTRPKCDHVLETTIGAIRPPDADNDGLYDVNVDCHWIVQAPNRHVIKYKLHFIDLEETPNCTDHLEIVEKDYRSDGVTLCGTSYDEKLGETKSNFLFVQFYSDGRVQGRGFNFTYVQIEAPKSCGVQRFLNKSGWISAPDRDGDGFYDFNLRCRWTVEADPTKYVQIQLMFVYIVPTPNCSYDSLEISDEFGKLAMFCGMNDSESRDIIESRSNLIYIKFTTDSFDSSVGFNLTYKEAEKEYGCFDQLRLTPYSGTVSETNNGLLCQAWSAQTPHKHTLISDNLFPIDGSAAAAKNYCRDIDERGQPWCFTTDPNIRLGICTLKICYENITSCWNVEHNSFGTIMAPDSDNDGFYDLTVDCLWTLIAKDDHVISFELHYVKVEETEACRKDGVLIMERGYTQVLCGSYEQVLGESLSDTLFINFYSDDAISFEGFEMTYVHKKAPVLDCGASYTGSGWLASPDRDEDGLYDFNLRCVWILKAEDDNIIWFQFLYVILAHRDALWVYDVNEDSLEQEKVYRAYYQGFLVLSKQPPERSERKKAYVGFLSDFIQNGIGFNLTYENIKEQVYAFNLTSDSGWIRSPDADADGFYDRLILCIWTIIAPKSYVSEIDIKFIRTEDSINCVKDYLIIFFRLGMKSPRICGHHGRQALIRSKNHIKGVAVVFKTDYKNMDIGFLLYYEHVATAPYHLSENAMSDGLLSADFDQDGQYDYNFFQKWLIKANDTRHYLILRVLYLDIEEQIQCGNDWLGIESSGYIYFMDRLCGVGINIPIKVDRYFAEVVFSTDYTINRMGFQMTYSEINGQSNSCGGVVTGFSDYLASADSDGDGNYDSYSNCYWEIMLDYTKVIVFEVLEIDIYQEALHCEADFLELSEEHREIGQYCGDVMKPALTTEANILNVLFKSDAVYSGKGFQALYIEAEDSSDCSQNYKCLLSDIIIQKSNVCDDFRDCPYGDDERFCQFRCPAGCTCIGLRIDCAGRYLCEFNKQVSSVANKTSALNATTRVLDVSNNPTVYHDLKLEEQNLIFITHLNLSACEIAALHENTFKSMKRLKVLDLSHNRLRYLRSRTFINQANLTTFLFNGNLELLIIETEAFSGLFSLKYLDLNDLHIERLSKGSFASLDLIELKIDYCHIDKMEDHSFDRLRVDGIYLNSSTINTYTETMFHGNAEIRLFITNNHKFCCVRPPSVFEDNCFPQEDEFSSCDDLIKKEVLRILIWIIGLLTLLSNIGSVMYRMAYRKEQMKYSFGTFTTHLAVSDFFLGVYLVIIAGADIRYRGIYKYNDESWRRSVICQLAGVLSTLSCEASILFVTLITADRFLVVKYPFGQHRFVLKNRHILSATVWVFALIIAIFPLVFTPYFKDEFYSKTSVCLALPVTRARPAGWDYSIAVFLAFNAIICLLVVFGQGLIFREIKASEKMLRTSRSKTTVDTRVTRNLLLVVMTNFLCWMPTIFTGILASVGYNIPADIYSWFAIIVLPINSTVNPVLYTLSELLRKKKNVPKADSQTIDVKKKNIFTTEDLYNALRIGKNPAFWQMQGQRRPRSIALTDELKEGGFGPKRLQLARDTIKLLVQLHDSQTIQRDFSVDDIFIQKKEQLPCKVALVCRPCLAKKATDYADNVFAFGLILSKMMRVPHTD